MSPISKDELAHWTIMWLVARYGEPANAQSPFFHGMVTSLAFLELLAACEADLHIRIPLHALSVGALETVGSFVEAAHQVAVPDVERRWHELELSCVSPRQRIALLLRLRARLPQSALIRESAPSSVGIGLPLDAKIDAAELRQILQEVQEAARE